MRNPVLKTAIILAAGCLAGCGADKPVELDTAGVTPAVDYAPLAKVMKNAVDEDGFVDADSLKESSKDLRRQLKLLAVTGPDASGNLLAHRSERLAYWYNARAAWALELARLAGTPEKISAGALENRKFPLNGRMMTLSEIDELLIERFGWSAAAAAPGILTTRAAIPQKPVEASPNTHRLIERRLNAFIDDEKRFVIDVRHRRVMVPEIIWRFGRRLVRRYNRLYGTQGANLLTALLPHTSGSPHRRLQDAVGYSARAAPRGKPAWKQ